MKAWTEADVVKSAVAKRTHARRKRKASTGKYEGRRTKLTPECGLHNQSRERQRPVSTYESRTTDHGPRITSQQKALWPNEPTLGASARPEENYEV